MEKIGTLVGAIIGNEGDCSESFYQILMNDFPPLIRWAFNRLEIIVEESDRSFYAYVQDYNDKGFARLILNKRQFNILGKTVISNFYLVAGYILIHELVHLFLRHHKEACPKGFNPNLWNEAQEFACNTTVKYFYSEDFSVKFIHQVTGHDSFPIIYGFPENLSTRGYYDLLVKKFGDTLRPKSTHVNPLNVNNELDVKGELISLPLTSVPASLNELNKQLRRESSTTDSELERQRIERYLRKVVPDYARWNQFLTKMTKTQFGEDYVSGFRKKNPRFVSANLSSYRLPYADKRFTENARPKVFCYLDVSSSMRDNDVLWCHDIAASIPTDKFDLVLHPFSSYVKNSISLSDLASIKGMGGTSFEAVIEHFQKQSNEKDSAFIFTDGDASIDWTESKSKIASRLHWIVSTTLNQSQKDEFLHSKSKIVFPEFFK